MSREKAQELLCESFGPFGKLRFPYVKMGNIDSLHLFGDTELMILAMYWHNRKRWRRTLDIGANLGLHTICMARLGMTVFAFEPDHEHFVKLQDNLLANKLSAKCSMAAVHTSNGTAKFVRVLNNLTGNHIEGYKDSYGPTEQVLVPMVDCRELWPNMDFAKIDSEGNESEMIMTMTRITLAHMQAVVEVRNAKNAKEIFDHLNSINVPMWSQKIGWRQVKQLSDMPHANREGSLFIGHKGPFD